MTGKQKAIIQLIGLICIYLLIGIICGPIITNWLLTEGEQNPIIIVIITLAAVVFLGLGAGVKSLAKVVRVNINASFCYLPIAQDIVVYHIVKAMRTKNKMHEVLKKFNLLLTGTCLTLIGCALKFGSPLIFTKILMDNSNMSNAEDVAIMMLQTNNILTTFLCLILVVAYLIRVAYFDNIFRLVYPSMAVRILAILPPVHLVLIAILPNQLSYLSKARE